MLNVTKTRRYVTIFSLSVLSACGGSSDGQPNVTHFIERSGRGAQVMIDWSQF